MGRGFSLNPLWRRRPLDKQEFPFLIRTGWASTQIKESSATQEFIKQTWRSIQNVISITIFMVQQSGSWRMEEGKDASSIYECNRKQVAYVLIKEAHKSDNLIGTHGDAYLMPFFSIGTERKTKSN